MENQTTNPYPQQPVPAKAKGGSKRLLFLLVLVLAAAVYGVYYWQTTERQNSTRELNQRISDLQAEKNNLEAKTKTEAESADDTKPVVVFTPGGVFKEQEKTDLTNKLVNPMADYNEGKILTVHIEVNSKDKYVIGDQDYKYFVTAIFEGGESSEFLFGSKKTGIDWWTPECLDKCTFTADFKKKYPEVVSKYESTNP